LFNINNPLDIFENLNIKYLLANLFYYLIVFMFDLLI